MNIFDYCDTPQIEEQSYPQRVCLALTSRHLDLSGGIANFILGLVKMFPNTLFDIVTDDSAEAQKWFGGHTNVNYSTIANTRLLPNNTFWNTSFNLNVHLSKTILISEALAEQCKRFVYDCIVVNDYESLYASLLTGLVGIMPVYYITHIPLKSQIYPAMFSELENLVLQHSKLRVITQLDTNKDEYLCASKMITAPLPITDDGFLIPYDGPRDGILFIGRHETRKAPEKFIEFVKRFPGTKVKILSGGKNPKEKWHKCLSEAGITNFEFGHKLVGDEKVHFIQSSKLAYHPSINESFGLCALETLYSCPTVLSEAPWADYFMQFPFSMRLSDFRLMTDFTFDKFDHRQQIADMMRLHQQPCLQTWKNIFFNRSVCPSKLTEPGILRKVSKTYQDIGTLVKTTLVDYEVEQIQKNFTLLEFRHTKSMTEIRRKE